MGGAEGRPHTIFWKGFFKSRRSNASHLRERGRHIASAAAGMGEDRKQMEDKFFNMNPIKSQEV